MRLPRTIVPHAARESIRMTGLYARTLGKAWLDRKPFAGVERYVMFIGYPRSGHTLVGALLDAHPDMVISHELDALKYVRAGFGRNQLFHLILENARRFTQSGRCWTGYCYQVPGGWHGRYRHLRIIGDKKGGRSTWWLRENPGLLRKLQEIVGCHVTLLHVVRNPFDNVATMTASGQYGPEIESNLDRYRKLCETNEALIECFDSQHVVELRLEQLIADPAPVLRHICCQLGVDTPQDYLQACSQFVAPSPSKTRHKVAWDASSRTQIEGLIERFTFLADYTFEA